MKTDLMTIQKLKKIIEDNKEMSEYYAILYDNSEYNIRFSNSRIISNRVSSDSFVEITSIVDKKVGVSSTTDLSEESIIKCIKKSYSIALESEESEEYTPLIENEQYDDSSNNSFDFKREVREIEDYLHSIFEKDNSIKIFGYITGEVSNISIINSSKLSKSTTIPRFSYSMNIKNDKLTRSVWRSNISSDSNIDLLKNIYTELLKDYTYTSIKKDLDPGRYKVVLSPSALGDLLMYMSFFLSAKEADEKRSPFKDLLGKKVFPEYINLYTDPFIKDIKSIPFLIFDTSGVNPIFDIGQSLFKQSIIENGVVKGLISTRYYDGKMGYKNNLPSVSNLILKGSDKEYIDFIKDIDDAIYINNLWYIRSVDPITGLLTGLTRDGVYKIENGKFAYSLNNFRFNQSPIKVLESITSFSKSYLATPREFGDSFLSSVICPYCVVENFNLSSISKAI